MAVKYRLFYNGNLSIAGAKVTTEPAYNDTTSLDDTLSLDDTNSFNDTLEMSTFFDYILGLTAGTTPVTRVGIDPYGNLIAPAINESASLGGLLGIGAGVVKVVLLLFFPRL